MGIDPLWTVDDLATHLKCPKGWIYDNSRTIPHKKIGREYRFRPSEIHRWVDSHHEGFPLKYLDM